MPVLATLIQLRAGGLVIGPDPFFSSQIEQVPAVYEWRRIGSELTIATWPWLVTMLIFLVMATYIPEMSLWLPRVLGML